MRDTSLIVPEWQKPVVVVPLAQHFPELGQVKEFRSKKCIFNHDKTKLFSVVSDKYRVLEHKKAISIVEKSIKDVLGEKPDVNVRSLGGGARLIATIDLKGLDPVTVEDPKDKVKFQLLLRNSYDGSWTFGARLNGFRLVCSNGLLTGHKFGSVRLKHATSIEESPIEEQLESMFLQSKKLEHVWRRWSEETMDYSQAAELLEGLFAKKYTDPILRESNFPKSKWKFYNDLTYFSTHRTPSLTRRLEFDDVISKLFYEDLEYA